MYCPNCGTGDQNLNFCTNCGTSLNQVANSNSSAPQPAATNPLSPQPIANPYQPSPNEPKKAIKPLWIIVPVAAVAAVALVITFVFGQSAGPLTQLQAGKWADSVVVPAGLSDFDDLAAEDPNDLSSTTYVPKFPDENRRCQAISDLDRLGRYMGSGNAGEQVLPDLLQGFDAWDGKRLGITVDEGGVYAYTNFAYGVLSFADASEAETYVADLAAAATGCSSLEDIDINGLSYFQDTEDLITVPGLDNSMRLNYSSAFGFSIGDRTTVIVSLQEFSIAQIGANVVFTHGVISEDAVSEIGIVIEDLTAASDDIFSQADNLLNAASRG
jgi:hypothetical protein